MLENIRKMDELSQLLTAAIAKGDAEDAKELLAKLKGPFELQVQLARSLAETCGDPKRRKEILEACDRLESLYPLLEEAVHSALANPNDKKAQQKVKQILGEMQEAMAQVIVLTHPNPEQRLVENGKELHEELDRLTQAVKKGDDVAAHVSLKHSQNRFFDRFD